MRGVVLGYVDCDPPDKAGIAIAPCPIKIFLPFVSGFTMLGGESTGIVASGS
jgi:hypothetical protein